MRVSGLILIVFVARAAFAQVPGMMNYQGFLTDTGGAPLSGSYNMAFKLYDAETGGVMLWEETHLGRLVSEGLFSVLLGETNALDASVFAGEAWLQLEVGGEPMDPRVRVVTVGHAFAAAVSHQAAPGSVDSAAIKDGEVVDADVSAAAAIDVSKLSGVLPLSGGTMTGALSLAGDPSANLEAATKSYVDQGVQACVRKSGDTMTGALSLPSDPSADMEAATKRYVDQAVVGVYVESVPVGAVIAWVKSFPKTPALPPNFAECNGQTIADPESPFDGEVLPDLNGSGGGLQKFLRGSTTSGATGGSETHTHTIFDNVTSGIAFGTGSTTTNPANHLPPYYEVVWVMRIK